VVSSANPQAFLTADDRKLRDEFLVAWTAASLNDIYTAFVEKTGLEYEKSTLPT
jgi:hypothetical protein